MDPAVEQLQLLLDLDARHEDLLRRLDELDRQVAQVLAEYGATTMQHKAFSAPEMGLAVAAAR